MMGAKESYEVQDELVKATAALTRAQAILYPHKDQDPPTGESAVVLGYIQRAQSYVDDAESSLDIA